MTRTCLACCGTGEFLDPFEAEFMYGYSQDGSGDCAACLGSGIVVDRIPAADALADAETLRKVLWTQPHRTRIGGYLNYCANFAARHARKAFDGNYYPYSWAKSAAHVALCAVPGLRA